MRGIKFFVLVIFVFTSIVYSQFHIEPTVNVNIIYGEGFKGNIKMILLSGQTQIGEIKVYLKELVSGKNQYTFYDVEPGKYTIVLNYEYNSIEKQSSILKIIEYIWIDEKTGEFGSTTGVMNEIEVRRDHNTKIDINLTSLYGSIGFSNKELKKYSGFDYYQLYFNYYESVDISGYSKISNNRNNNLTEKRASTGNSGKENKNIKKTNSKNINNVEKNNENVFPEIPDICCTKSEEPILISSKKGPCPGVKCKEKLFDYNTIGLYFQFKGIKYVSKGYSNVIGIRDEKINKTICGVFEHKINWVLPGGVGNYAECCKSNTEKKCFCFYFFNFLKFIASSDIAIWKKEEIDIKNRDIDCLIKSIIFHERYHCKSYIEILKDELKKFNPCNIDIRIRCTQNDNCYSRNFKRIVASKIAGKFKVRVKKRVDIQTIIDHEYLYNEGAQEKYYEDCVNSKK